MTAEVSHGRGGAGNINPDDTQYVDGEVVRTGPEGSQGHGAYSAGRGGAGNIGDAGSAPAPRSDKDLVPEEAYRPSTENQDYHGGRGGAGNAHKSIDHEKKAAAQARADGTAGVSVADKLKAKILAPFHKK
ncbi:hypothetical protein CGCF415_v001521 [Colletotrichum fructicola]|uniref:Uncharacterized protein n=5 Tax=Colletotrichum gloeosporioides species complex TaxID=2707338 RepID=L2G372_COLFN|nr:uncharacterized protein CGMCC3_g5215 [Colletotrichum fructicola]XP_036502005.1 uncharacterized protein CGCS363_v000499 [Colletotrichum siamense]XP_037184837.1 uncharacterized protein CGCA056_v000489 [Colletotrichum aenigma]XP_053035091.1 uncharacterized protein COL26b_008189 [Colletotrichum chrysophilum]KAF0332154.1 hypothetical protein GQ607_000170 [Colletotrichum asianum]KAF4491739.1 hypothetical protein CGGC5_v000544 [Colletotrichum fructicola Nara gc5]KAF4836572.1 hypothetical protein 